MLSDYFAQVNGRKIVAVTAAVPPHELTENQIDLTKDEFIFLGKYSLEEAEILIQNVRAKMEVLK